MQKELTGLRSENFTLKSRLAELEQSNRAAIARAADLETQVFALREALAKATPPPPPPEAEIEDPRIAYNKALELFRSRRYDDAAELLRTLMNDGVPAPLKDNCQYWLGECAFGAKRFTEALPHFEKVFAFEWSEKKDDAQVMIARTYGALGDPEKAKESYERLIKKFPASPYVMFAKGRLAKL